MSKRKRAEEDHEGGEGGVDQDLVDSTSELNETTSLSKKTPLTKKSRKSVEDKSADHTEQLESYLNVLEAIRANESVVIDTRLNFTYGLPKKARIPRSSQQWRAMQGLQGKLTPNYGQIDICTVRIEGPLTYDDIQPVRADNNNFRYLKPGEIGPKLRALPRTVLLGSAISIAQHPSFGMSRDFRAEAFAKSDSATTTTSSAAATAAANEEMTEAEEANSPKRGKSSAPKKPGLQQEWIIWTHDRNGRHFPMTPATFGDLMRMGYSRANGKDLEFHSPSGWTMFCDEDRMFVVPKAWIQQLVKPENNNNNTTTTTTNTTTSSTSASTCTATVTPAVQLSKSASLLMAQASPAPPPPALPPALEPAQTIST